MWIAKNSITGITYGKLFNDIIECQCFIDRELFLLEYEFQRCLSLEKKVLDDFDAKNRGLGAIFEHFNRDCEELLHQPIQEMCQELFIPKKVKDLQEYKRNLIRDNLTTWYKNNIIRCWYVEQKRFATGFDF